MWASKPYREACALQKLITDKTKDPLCKDIAQLGKTFVALEMLKLRLRMKPAPKPIDTVKHAAKVNHLATAPFQE